MVMAEIVGAFATLHMPGSPGQVKQEGPESETGRLFDAVRDHLKP